MRRNYLDPILIQMRTNDVHRLFDQVHQNVTRPQDTIHQAAYDSERARVVSLVNSRAGSFMYDQKLLSLNDLLNVQSVEGLRKIIDCYEEIINYYDQNEDTIYWVLKQGSYIKEKLTSGSIEYWYRLLEHKDINLKRLSDSATKTFMLDALTHMDTTNAESMNLRNSVNLKKDLRIATLSKVEQARAVLLATAVRDKQTNAATTANINSTATQQQQAENLSNAITAAAIEEAKEDEEEEIAEELKKASELAIQSKAIIARRELEEQQNCEDEEAIVHTKPQQQTELAKVAAQEEAQMKLAREKELQNELAADAARIAANQELQRKQKAEVDTVQFEERVLLLGNIIYKSLNNLELWSHQVSSLGNAPSVSGMIDGKKCETKIPSGIARMRGMLPMNYAISNLSRSVKVSYILEAFGAMKGVADEKKVASGTLFSGRKDATKAFYKYIGDLAPILQMETHDLSQFKKMDELIVELTKFTPGSTKIVTARPTFA